MSAYDELRVLYPLPVGGKDVEFQTKSTRAMFCDQYELRDEGTLWHHAYDSEVEQSADNPLGFVMRCSNHRWEREAWTGALRFYASIGEDGWLEYAAWMVDGVLRDLQLLEHKLPTR